MTAAFLDKQPHLFDVWSSMNPLGRLGRPDELRGVVTWLASDASTFCTGSEYVVSIVFPYLAVKLTVKFAALLSAVVTTPGNGTLKEEGLICRIYERKACCICRENRLEPRIESHRRDCWVYNKSQVDFQRANQRPRAWVSLNPLCEPRCCRSILHGSEHVISAADCKIAPSWSVLGGRHSWQNR
jgi:hypothetical protein